MKHVETNTYDVKRLLHVKGKRNIRATEVSPTHDCLGPSVPALAPKTTSNSSGLSHAGGNELGQF